MPIPVSPVDELDIELVEDPSNVPITGTDNGTIGNPITGMLPVLCPITGTAAPDPATSYPKPKPNSKSSPTAPVRVEVEGPVVSCDNDDEEEEAEAKEEADDPSCAPVEQHQPLSLHRGKKAKKKDARDLPDNTAVCDPLGDDSIDPSPIATFFLRIPRWLSAGYLHLSARRWHCL